MHALRSTRGASRGVLECGSGAVVAKGCNTHTRVATAEAERSRRAYRAPLGALGGMSYRRCQPPRHAEAPAAVVRPPSREQGSLKRRDHRGSRRIRLKHRARDAGEIADLRNTNPSGALSRSIAPLQFRERLKPAGPTRPRRPAPPSLFGGSRCKNSDANAPRECGRLTFGRDGDDATCEPRARSPSPGGGGSTRTQ
jgi:hypothetical protein